MRPGIGLKQSHQDTGRSHPCKETSKHHGAAVLEKIVAPEPDGHRSENGDQTRSDHFLDCGLSGNFDALTVFG